MYFRYQRSKKINDNVFVTVGNRGPRLGVKLGKATASIGASGPSLSIRLLKGLSTQLFR